MTRTRKAWYYLFTLTIIGVPAPVAAYCNAIRTLADVHNQYFILVAYDGQTRQRAAARLYPMLSAIDPQTVLDDVDIAFDETRWQDIHAMATKISKDLTTGISYSIYALAPHTDNVEWLRAFIASTPCKFDAPPKNRFIPSGSGVTQAPIGATNAPTRTSQQSQSLSMQTILALLGTLIVCGASYFLWKSRVVRQMRAARLPRSVIDLKFDLVEMSSNQLPALQSVVAQDVSLGGMKVKINDPLGDKAFLALHLPIGTRTGSVAWSNPHYAGILFDYQLSEEELEELLFETKTAPDTSEAAKS